MLPLEGGQSPPHPHLTPAKRGYEGHLVSTQSGASADHMGRDRLGDSLVRCKCGSQLGLLGHTWEREPRSLAAARRGRESRLPTWLRVLGGLPASSVPRWGVRGKEKPRDNPLVVS